MKRVSADDLALAADWLDCYESDDDSVDDEDACARVAQYLRSLIVQRAVAATARRNKVSRATVREAIARAADRGIE